MALRKLLQKLFQYIFEALSFSFFLFFAAEMMKEGLVTNYFVFNGLLTLLVIFVIIGAGGMIQAERHQRKRPIRRIVVHITILAFSLVVGFFLSGMISDTLAVLKIVPAIVAVGIYFSLLMIFFYDRRSNN